MHAAEYINYRELRCNMVQAVSGLERSAPVSGDVRGGPKCEFFHAGLWLAHSVDMFCSVFWRVFRRESRSHLMSKLGQRPECPSLNPVRAANRT